MASLFLLDEGSTSESWSGAHAGICWDCSDFVGGEGEVNRSSKQ